MISFKTSRQRDEFFTDVVSRDVKIVALALSAYMEGRHETDIVVTGVLPEQGIKRKSASHRDGRAIDIRVRDWPDGVAAQVEEWINNRFRTGALFPDGKPMQVCLMHNVGRGIHFHLQVAKGRPVQIVAANDETLLI